MLSKNLNKDTTVYDRTFFYSLQKNQSKNKKIFNYPKKKTYVEEMKNYPLSKKEKENDLNECNNPNHSNDNDIEIIYEGKYQGLIYYPKYIDLDMNNIYYVEKEKKDEHNNFKTKWKTEICRYWEMYGECKYGDNCAFAHGDSELKQKKLTFNYKTKPCKQYFESGYCSYGPRCQFSHKKENVEKQKNDEVSYLKIIEELLSEEKKDTISHELVKRPRLMIFENITHCTLEESENSKLKLYEDIINLKNEKSKKFKKKDNFNFKFSDDTNSNSNSIASSNEANDNDKEYF